MKNKKILLSLFLLVAIAQLLVPLQMIWKQEDIISTGKIYKFRCEPIDPNDPFRGKYVTLSYKERIITVRYTKNWNNNETVFAKISTSKKGFAKISSISKTEPEDNSIYLKLTIDYISNYNNENKIYLEFPFNRFYMNENKASNAEQVYRETIIDTTKITYALVAIKKGKAVIKDVIIDKISIKNLAKTKSNSKT